MSIQSEINRINSNIANAYDELETKGATMPQTENSANLATTIASIPSGGGITPTYDTINDVLIKYIKPESDYGSSTPVTLYTPDANCMNYVIQKKSNGKYRVDWCPCPIRATDSIRFTPLYINQMTKSFENQQQVTITYSANNPNASSVTAYYGSDVDTLQDAIDYAKNPNSSYTQYTGTGYSYEAEGQYKVPYCNTMVGAVGSDILTGIIPNRQISSDETILVMEE